jgi:glucosamine--fructose-6-phosphate aminotransferase (isomerizing)
LNNVEASLSEHRIVEGQYLRDILDQPRALEATLARLDVSSVLGTLATRVRKGEIKRLVLTGMGASLHALHPFELQLTEAGLNAVTVETSELIHYQSRLITEDALLVVVSQSGESAETIRLLELNGGRALVVGITNNANSTLARRALSAMVTHAGTEFSVSCKTYVAALMALRLLAAVFCGEEPDEILDRLETLPEKFANYLHSWREHALAVAGEMEGVRQVFLLGRGPSLAAARSGALILKESVRFNSEGMSGAAFRHGPMEMLNREIFALVFSGANKTRELQQNMLRDIQNAGGRTAWVEEGTASSPWKVPAVPDDLRHIVEILPAQMVTLGLAAQKGIEAGRFAIATKVTTTE